MGKKQTVHRLRLDNGLIVIVGENPTADLIAGRIFLKNAGSLWEPREKAGLSNLLATVITKGTQNLSSGQIAEAVESIGAGLGADASSDYFMISVKTISKDFASMLELISEILRSPTFPEAEIALEKRLIAQAIRSQKEQPFNVAFNHLREMIYQDHPYGLSILGDEQTVSQLCREDLINYHKYHFRPDNLIVSLSGRINVDDAVDLVEKTLGDWPIPSHTLSRQNLPKLSSCPVEKIINQDTQQSIIMLGYLTVGVKSPDYPVLKLLSTYLGSGLSSRLFVELREKRGLAYDVSAIYPTRLEPSQFVLYMGTAPQNTTIAIEGLQKEAERLCYQELTPEELQGAKNKLLGQYALGKQTNGELAQLYGWYETLGLGVEFDHEFQAMISKVTAEIAQNVAKNYLLSPYLSVVSSNYSTTH